MHFRDFQALEGPEQASFSRPIVSEQECRRRRESAAREGGRARSIATRPPDRWTPGAKKCRGGRHKEVRRSASGILAKGKLGRPRT